MGRASASLFAQLDPDGRGYVTLHDINRLPEVVQAQPRLRLAPSLLQLFQLDPARAGRWTESGLGRITASLQGTSSFSSSSALSSSCTSCVAALASRICVCFATARSHGPAVPQLQQVAPSDPGFVTLLTGSSSDVSCTDHAVSLVSLEQHEPGCHGVPLPLAPADPVLAAERVRVVHSLQHADLSVLEDTRAAEAFAAWLHAVSDPHRSGNITAQTLAPLLVALRRDGVHPFALLDTPVSLPTPAEADDADNDEAVMRAVADAVIAAYRGTDSQTSLNSCDFRILATVIVREYRGRGLSQSLGMTHVGPYTLTRILGLGSAGVVRLAVRRDTGDRSAVKAIRVRPGDCGYLAELDREIAALQRLRHPHVLRLDAVLRVPSAVLLVSECCVGGSLYHRVPMPAESARFVFAQVLDAVCHAHEHGVVHRDIRVDNILFDRAGNAKLVDFGHAGLFRVASAADGTDDDQFFERNVGSVFHMAPEQLPSSSRTSYSGRSLDAWSLGVLLYHMLTGEPPFQGDDEASFHAAVAAARLPDHPAVPPAAHALIASLCTADPSARRSAHDARQDRWLIDPPPERPATSGLAQQIRLLPGKSAVAAIPQMLRDVASLHVDHADEAAGVWKASVRRQDAQLRISAAKPAVILFELLVGGHTSFQHTLHRCDAALVAREILPPV